MVKTFLCFLVLLVPVMNRAGSGIPAPAMEDQRGLYAAMNLSEIGLTDKVFRLALKGHDKLGHEGKLRNTALLTIVDFSQSSRNKRLYVIDLLHKLVLFNTYVAHGRKTGDEYAKYFSNIAGSLQSSLGFYVTRQEQSGSQVGLSLIIEGVEKGFNDNALRREIIIHGAVYATENFIRKTGRLGRSFGCPSLPPDLIKPVIEAIKEGTCLFIFHQDDRYLSHSALLN